MAVDETAIYHISTLLFLGIVWIRHRSAYRANGSALRLIKMSIALDALAGIDDIDGITFTNCLNWTLRLAKSACSTFIINFICHCASLLVGIISRNYLLSRNSRIRAFSSS